MDSKPTIASRVLRFQGVLAGTSLVLPTGYGDVNPFRGPQSKGVREVSAAFYQRFYNDHRPRRLILGSSPARRGTAVTGVPFEDVRYLESCAGAPVDGYAVNRSSADFLLEVIQEYGGRQAFYGDFCMGFVCPLGIVKRSPKGREVNCNYYEGKELMRSLSPFIVETLKLQLGFGVDTSVCYCIGSGENYRFLSRVNRELGLFQEVVPLEHPRFITQYNPGKRSQFLDRYISVLRGEG